MTEPAVPQAVRFLVADRVQGVSYRLWSCDQAAQLGLDGWVRNLPDGRVEALAIGTAAAVDELQRRLSRGPAAARVTGVQRQALPADSPAREGVVQGGGFRILR